MIGRRAVNPIIVQTVNLLHSFSPVRRFGERIREDVRSEWVELLEINEGMIAPVAGVLEPPLPLVRRKEAATG